MIRRAVILAYFVLLVATIKAGASAPQLRIKTGISSLTVTAGNVVEKEPLKSLVTFQPTVLWDMPMISSRFGLHYMQELGSPYGLTPLSGIGLSGYFYPFGVSSKYEIQPDQIVLQASKPAPYFIGCLTPVNFNMNKFSETNTADNFSFGSVVNEVGAGIGFDYPMMSNMVVAGEILLRNGVASSSTETNVSYSGWSIFVSLATFYY